IAVIALALGIGANAAIFSVVKAVIWRPLPYQQPEQLVMVWERSVKERSPQPSPNSPALFLEWRNRQDVFAEVAAYEDAAISHRARYYLTGGNEPERISGALVSGNLFSLLGVEAALGRTFSLEEEQPGHEQVVVLSHAFWQRWFDGDRNAIGKTIRLNDRPFRVIGVMPPEFKFSYPDSTQLWTPLTFGTEERTSWNHAAYQVVGRLKPGVTIQQAQAAMSRLTQHLEEFRVKPSQNLYVQLTPLHQYHFGAMRQPLLLLLGAVAAVMLIGCVNITNLLLVRLMERRRELAVRAALGAGRGRLIRQLLTESLILAALGGGAGILFAFGGRDLLLTLLPKAMPRGEEVAIDGWVLGVTWLLSISVGIGSGLLPALRSSRPDLNESLKAGTPNSTLQVRTRRVHNWLVIAETALSLALLIGAGLMIRSVWQLRQVELGFNPDQVLTMHFTIPPHKYESLQKRERDSIEMSERAFIDRVVDRIRALPGVQSAAATASVPLRGVDYAAGFLIVGEQAPADGRLRARYRIVGTDYFRTMGIRLLKGRTFTDQDTAQSGRVVVVTAELARRYFPNEELLGRQLELFGEKAEIVGVVADVRHKRPDQPLESAFYIPFGQKSFNPMALVVRTTGDPSQLAQSVRQAVWAEDKDQPVEGIATMAEITAAAISDSRFYSILLGAFALMALLLAATGIYGVTSYSVTQRTPEIGIRLVLGADRADVLRLILKEGMKLTSIGITLGLIAALGLTQLMKSLMFGISPLDPVTFGSVSALLTLVSLLASYLPARRAARTSPIVALRNE
ncbi:MAG TPA: ABC transporter permease, partial [Blastocatellia bacterium]|nr:ABC transporter permease [Blastocatellia bacterium]